MANTFNSSMDATDWHLLVALQENARLSFSELGRKVGLTPPAVAERVRRMEDRGVIAGYHAHVDLAALGYPITALMTVTYPASSSADMYALAERLPEIRECFHVTGAGSAVLKVVVRSIPHLEALIERIKTVGITASETAIVLSTPVFKTTFEPQDQEQQMT